MALSSSECINSRERITRVFCKVDTKIYGHADYSKFINKTGSERKRCN